MQFQAPMLLTKDIEKAKKFYIDILGLHVIEDLGENVSLSGGIGLQTEESWIEFIKADLNSISHQSNNVEMYFEEREFDGFIRHLNNMKIEYIGEVITMPWGQRVVRLYDPDKHIIQVGEDFILVVNRLYSDGLSIEDISILTCLSIEVIRIMLRESECDLLE